MRSVKDLHQRLRTLFVSPRNPSKPLLKNALSYFLREVISQAPGSGAGVGSLAFPIH